jgi:hypothetical protein
MTCRGNKEIKRMREILTNIEGGGGRREGVK